MKDAKARRAIKILMPKKHRLVWVHGEGFFTDGAIETLDYHETTEEAMKCEEGVVE